MAGKYRLKFQNHIPVTSIVSNKCTNLKNPLNSLKNDIVFAFCTICSLSEQNNIN